MTESKMGAPEKAPGFIDYSIVYKEKEIKQLNKRLRKTRNILLIASLAFLLGGMVFRLMPESAFSMQSLLFYIIMAFILACIALLSSRKPYKFLLFGLFICIASWGAELLLGNTDNFLIE